MSNSARNNPGPWNGTHKRCLDCDEVKPLADFPPAKRRLDGRTSYCRPCMNKRSLASRRKKLAEQGRSITPRRDVPDGQRWCPDCESFKALEEFPANRSGRNGRGGYCKPCHNARTHANRVKNHGSTRDFHLRRRYGINSVDYDRILAEQGGLCAGCHKVAPAHVDHDHETGKVRGLLCFNCNQALGNLRDDLQVIDSLGTYLSRNRNGYAPLRAYLPPQRVSIEYVPTVRHGRWS